MQARFFFLLFFLNIFLSLFFSCSSSDASPPPVDPATEKFSSYLKNNFADSIPYQHHLYILVSKKNSRENVAKILSRLKMEMKNKKTENFSTIISVNMPIADSLILPGKIHNDWDAAVDELGLNFSCVTFIQTEKNKIAEILQLSVDSTGMEKQFLEW